jgi:HlyD family secretion protein
MRVTRRRVLWGIGIVVVLGGVGWMMRPEPIVVETALVVRGNLRVTVDGDARARVRSRYVVTAPIAGRLERIALMEGDSVRRGDAVGRMMPAPLDPQAELQARARVSGAEALQREAEAHVRQARLAAEQAERDAARARTLEKAGAIAPVQREQAELAASARQDDVAAAEQRARAAAADVEGSHAALIAADRVAAGDVVVAIRAPASGRVLRILERSERVVAPGTPIIELGDPSSMEVVMDVLSGDALRIARGDAVSFDGALGENGLRGRVRRVEPAATTRISALGVEEQRVDVIIDLLTSAASLGDGYRVDASIQIWQGSNVLTVPSSALFRDGDAWAAFVVRDQRVTKQIVQLGQRADAAAEVVGGLAEGDVVVLFPSDQLRDGVRVRVP